MILKRDDLKLGLILGFVGPLIGILIYKFVKLKVLSFKEMIQYMVYEPGHATLSVALTLALFVNAVLFTLYLNGRRDKTAKGIFLVTLIYGVAVLFLKLF
ncbi:MAG: hypothetical protein KA319_00400 [Ferruginibacter sp.]|nr:hypothetical protein [Ferruginibacter sp.]